VGPTRQPHSPNNGAARANRVWTTAAAALPPTASPPPPRYHSLTAAPSPSIKGPHRPPSSAALFPPPPLHCHCAIMSVSLSCHETLPWSPSKPLDTAPSFAPTLGAPSTSLPTPSAAPLLHHRRSTAIAPHRSVCATVESYAPVNPPLSSATKLVCHPTSLLSGHSTAVHRPAGFHRQVTGADRGEDLPCFSLEPKGSVGWARKAVAKWAWPIPTVPFLFFRINSKFN
jgi:hypothetical protein